MNHRVLVVVCAITLVASAALAQTFTGNITGTVTDPAGAVDPGAVLTVTNLETNESRRLTSNESGLFNFTALPPGRYRFEVERPGFKRFLQEPIELRVQQSLVLLPQLEVGQATQTLEVTGQAPLVDAATSSLSQIVENREVTELPLNGRNTLALVSLTPGVRTPGQFLQNQATRR